VDTEASGLRLQYRYDTIKLNVDMLLQQTDWMYTHIPMKMLLLLLLLLLLLRCRVITEEVLYVGCLTKHWRQDLWGSLRELQHTTPYIAKSA